MGLWGGYARAFANFGKRDPFRKTSVPDTRNRLRTEIFRDNVGSDCLAGLRDQCESLCETNPRTVVTLISLYKTQPLGYNTSMDKKLISKVMAELGRRTSKAKAAAARENGKKGGRPRKSKVKRGAK